MSTSQPRENGRFSTVPKQPRNLAKKTAPPIKSAAPTTPPTPVGEPTSAGASTFPFDRCDTCGQFAASNHQCPTPVAVDDSDAERALEGRRALPYGVITKEQRDRLTNDDYREVARIMASNDLTAMRVEAESGRQGTASTKVAAFRVAQLENAYADRVRALEAEGIPTSDAQGIVDAEDYLAAGNAPKGVESEPYDVTTRNGMEVTVYPVGKWSDFPRGDGGVFRFCPHQEAVVYYNDDRDEDDHPWEAELTHIDSEGCTIKSYGYGEGDTYAEFRDSIGDAEELASRQAQCECCSDDSRCKECGFGKGEEEHAPQCSQYVR